MKVGSFRHRGLKRLYEAGQDAEGKVFENLQADGAIAAKDVQHLIFTFAGKDPSKLLAAAPKPKKAKAARSDAWRAYVGGGKRR